MFDGNILVSGYPKPLTALGLPEELDRVDAATVWGHNSKTYIFSGTMYWRYDDETERMELDYPRDMNIWRGVGDNINAAFQWHDGKHRPIFVLGLFVSIYDTRMYRVRSRSEIRLSPYKY